MDVECINIDDDSDSFEDTADFPDPDGDNDVTLKGNRYNALTLAERIAVIQEYDKTRSTGHLAKLFGCSKTQILFIIKHRHEYEAEWERNSNPRRVRRAVSPHLLGLGIILFEYVWRMRHYPIEVTEDNLKTVAQAFAEKMNFHKFKPSKRWLQRFLSYYRLNGSILMSSEVVSDGKKTKTLQLDFIFRDLENEFRKKGIIITELNESHLDSLKFLRAQKINTSLLVEPRRKIIRIPTKITDSLNFVADIEENQTVTETINMIKDEVRVEYEEFPSNDAYDAESLKYAQENCIENNIYNKNYNCARNDNDDDAGIKTYHDALQHIKSVTDFLLIKEDLRGIGLLNHLENYLKDKSRENTK